MADPIGRIIKVKKVDPVASSGKPRGNGDLLGKLCYFYPQYTLSAARKLPYKHVTMLLKTAEVQRAIYYQELLCIAMAPHTKALVKDLQNHYKSVIDRQ